MSRGWNKSFHRNERLLGVDIRPTGARSTPCGISHIAVVTRDLDGYRAFYEDTIGLHTALVLSAGPGHGRQAVVFAGDAMLHVFEVIDREPAAQLTAPKIFERGHLDHFGFTVPDEAALTEVWYRLLGVGAASGDIRPVGSMLSVRYLDPDGHEGEINCFNPHVASSALRDEDEIIDPGWLERTRRALHAGEARSAPLSSPFPPLPGGARVGRRRM
jgi:catechol 2,3-dioxygenase-like lactoylglutathione lyase family enzyme